MLEINFNRKSQPASCCIPESFILSQYALLQSEDAAAGNYYILQPL